MKLPSLYRICVFFVGLWGIVACTKSPADFTNQLKLTQVIAFPVGWVNVNMQYFTSDQSDTTKGRYGSFFFNGNIFSNNQPEIIRVNSLGFSLKDQVSQDQWLEQLDVKLIVKNKFPVVFKTQVYFQINSSLRGDSIFKDGPITVDPAITNDQGDVVSETKKIFEVTLSTSQLENILKAGELIAVSSIQTTSSKFVIPVFSDSTLAAIHIGLRMHLGYLVNKSNP